MSFSVPAWKVYKLLDNCTSSHTIDPKGSEYEVSSNGKSYYLPLNSDEIEKGHILAMIWQLGINQECAEKFVGNLSDLHPSLLN